MSKRMLVIAACAWIPARALAEGDGATMKAIRVHEVGGTQQLRLEDAPHANPTPFVWTKSAHTIVRDHRRVLDRISREEH